MYFNKTTGYGLLLLVILMSFLSCRKETPDNEFQTTIDYSLSSAEFSSIQTLVDAEARSDSSVYGKTVGTTGFYCPGATATVTNLTANSATLEIDFGSGSSCLDGRTRTGMLTAVFNGKWRNAGSTVNITPTNYTVNGYPVSFNQEMTNNGRNNSGNWSWDTQVTNGEIITPTGTITYESTRITEWIAGEGDLDPSTNEYLVTGAATGTARTGLAYTLNIDSPLHIKANCPNMVAGVLSLTPAGLETRSIDYGDGTCDNQAVFTLGNFSTTITLQ